MSDTLTMYVIYAQPRDYPDAFICRRHMVRRGEVSVDQLLFAAGETLGEIRARLPGGLTNIGRKPDDVPAIAEVWL